jgi:NADH-quinone oxidoreductase subunit G
MPVAAPGESQSHESGELELVTGDCLFHSGYISQNSTILETLAAEPYVEMSPREASALGLSDRDQVIVRSRHGEAKARLRVTRRFPDGVVFIPENFAEMRLNLLIKQGEHPCRVAVCKEEGIRDTIAT